MKSIIKGSNLVSQYKQDGAILVKNAFSQDWLSKIAIGIEKNMKSPSKYADVLLNSTKEAKGPIFFGDYCNWRNIPEFKDLIYNSPAAQIASELMESKKSIFYHEHVLVKEPGSNRKTPWHHDYPYYPIKGDQCCSIWVSLDQVDINTCVQFIKGSQLWNKLYKPKKFETEMDYKTFVEDSRFNSFDIDVTKETILNWNMEPGDCIVFNFKTVHGAPGNMSLNKRRAIALRFFGDDVRFSSDRPEISPPITGGLKDGDSMECDEFPLIYKSK